MEVGRDSFMPCISSNILPRLLIDIPNPNLGLSNCVRMPNDSNNACENWLDILLIA